MTNEQSRSIDRRTVTAGMAWAVPAVATAAAAPAFAASQDPTHCYRFRGSVFSRVESWGEQSCYNGTYGGHGFPLADLRFDNQTPVGTSPLGFSIVEMPLSDGSGQSERTLATLDSPVEFVIAYPAGMVDMSRGVNGFTFSNGTDANWSGPSCRQSTATDPRGVTQTYDVFTFTWCGSLTQETVEDQTDAGTRPISWSDTALSGSWNVNTGYCFVDDSEYFFSNYYAGGTAEQLNGPFGTFTTANGFAGEVVSNSPSTGGWILLQRD